jgi:hypothetical protein
MPCVSPPILPVADGNLGQRTMNSIANVSSIGGENPLRHAGITGLCRRPAETVLHN